MAVNFGPSEKSINSDIHCSEIFQKNSCIHPPHKSNEEILEEVKVEPVDKKLQYKSSWLYHVRRVNNTMPKVMWKYRPNGLGGGGVGRLLDKAQLVMIFCSE
jgi:hypothetical protein